MKIIAWLRDRTPAQSDPPPQIVLAGKADEHGLQGVVLSDHDEAESNDRQQDHSPTEIRRFLLEPYFSMIEYTDAAGNFSRRRVTMRHVDDNGETRTLFAYCHERRAMRAFRLDRISCLIDQDGEVEDAAPWFDEILAVSDVAQIANPRPRSTTNDDHTVTPYTALRRQITPPLTVLIAAARSDDYLHPKEVQKILRYAEDEAAFLRDRGLLPGNPEAEEYEKLERTIRRLRPTREDLEAGFAAVAKLDVARQRHLARALAETAAADGRVDEIEAAIIEEFHEIGARQHGFGWAD